MYHRQLAARILDSLSDTPVVFLQGARQTGKSTLVQALANSEYPADYLSLDTMAVRSAATADPEGFIAGLEGPVVLDEVQRAPELALAIKAAVDADRQSGRFLLTGSANIMLLPKLSESLAGRIELHTLWPLSQNEIDGSESENFIDRLFSDHFSAQGGFEPIEFGDLADRVLRGGYPDALTRRPTRQAAWFDAYISTILQRDVREIANIEHLAQMPRLLTLLASRTGSLLNYSSLARDLALPQSTLKRYMALFEATFLVRPLPPWSANLGKRLVKSSKLMLTDTGLLSHLLGLDAERLKADRTLAGPVLENFAAMEVIKQLGWSRTRCELFHFRTDTGHEVDMVLEDRRGRLIGIEIKAAASVQGKDVRGLRTLAELAGERFVRGVLLYTGGVTVPFARNLHALPISALWAM
ncbi:MAG: ATP-binding protein [Nitrococcus sp.]|nr:ATP-binding protein [Nitrococcus sp.]